MKRRDFLKIAAIAPVAAAIDPLSLAQAQIPPTRPQGPPPGFPGRNAGPAVYEPDGPGITVRFLGTGGAAFHGPSEHIAVEDMDKAVEILLNIVCDREE